MARAGAPAGVAGTPPLPWGSRPPCGWPPGSAARGAVVGDRDVHVPELGEPVQDGGLGCADGVLRRGLEHRAVDQLTSVLPADAAEELLERGLVGEAGVD